MPRSLLVLLALIPLTGCALPPALMVASYAADGILLLASGKTSTDHLLSMVEKRDCAVWRVVKDESICKEYVDGRDPYDDWREPGEVFVANDWGDAAMPIDIAEHNRRRVQAMHDAQIAKQEKARRIQLAQAEPGQPVISARDVVGPSNRNGGAAVTSTALPPLPDAANADAAPPNPPAPVAVNDSRPAQLAPASLQPAPVSVESVSAQPTPAKAPIRKSSAAAPVAAKSATGGVYVVIGSYRVEENARRVVARHEALNPSLRPATVNGQRYTRVVAGPFSPAEAADVRRQLKERDGIDTFTAAGCDALSSGVCIGGSDG